MLWKEIETLATSKGYERFTLEGYKHPMFVFPAPDAAGGANWLVGRYAEMRVLVVTLEGNKSLQENNGHKYESWREFLDEKNIRLGLRATDAPSPKPKDERRKRYGAYMVGDNPTGNFNNPEDRPNPIAKPALPGASAEPNRLGDREKNKKEYWDDRTFECHHIVEFNNLEAIGASTEMGTGEMDYNHLPAVLLAAEFHQRYFTSYLKTRRPPKSKMPKGPYTEQQEFEMDNVRKGIVHTYDYLYTVCSNLFLPLWDISEIILRNANCPVPYGSK
jgi:hypothetical protein